MHGSAVRSIPAPGGAGSRWSAAATRLHRRARQVVRDRRGGVAVFTALMVPVLAGFAGIGTEIGLWMHARQTMQGAADTAALAGATAAAAGNAANSAAEARAIAASYGYVDGAGGATVTVNRPPLGGNF